MAAIGWLARRPLLTPTIRCGLSMLVAGLVPALTLDIPGASQLFFAYDSQLFLAVIGGAGLVALLTAPVRRVWPAVVIGLVAVPIVHRVAWGVPNSLRADAFAAARASGPWTREYLRALAWLRVNGTLSTVVLADNSSFALSALGEVRSFYENGTFTERCFSAARNGESCWSERVELVRRIVRHADPAAVAEARRLVGGATRLLVVVDRVVWRDRDGVFYQRPLPLDPPGAPRPHFLRELFANDMMRVYEVDGR
jgi:hypothetical protein